MLATTACQPPADGGVIAGVRSGWGGRWGRGRRRTEVIDRVVRGHALGNACEDVECGMRIEEGAAEVREVRDEYAWVELSLEEAETGVLEPCLAQALEAESLVDVCQFFCLRKSY